MFHSKNIPYIVHGMSLCISRVFMERLTKDEEIEPTRNLCVHKPTLYLINQTFLSL